MKREHLFFFALTFAALLTSCSPSTHQLWFERLRSVDSRFLTDSAMWEISRDSNTVKEILKSAEASVAYATMRNEEYERSLHQEWDTLHLFVFDKSDTGYVTYSPEPNPQLAPNVYGPNLPLFYGPQEDGSAWIEPPTPYRLGTSKWSSYEGKRFHMKYEIVPKGSQDFELGGAHTK